MDGSGFERRDGLARAIEELELEGVRAVGEAAAIEHAAECGRLPEEEFAAWMDGVATAGSADPPDVDGVQDVGFSVPLVVGPAVRAGHVVDEDLIVRGAGGCGGLKVDHDGQFAAERCRGGLVEWSGSDAHQEWVVGEEGAGSFSDECFGVVQGGGDFS